ncbi:hypothetical protein [Paenibacillus campi]|uniref:hypothetical protein n=1 Tax=Paenibacillus campi TaxID=3106031 RepID=UPI002AFFE8B1|nr:hypothetical protein [Paenibacillus sp. SGZ-1009]
MKIINWAVIFVLILLFVFVINSLDQQNNRVNLQLQIRYNKAVDTATQDAANALMNNTSQPQESQYESTKQTRINKEAAADTFLRTMYLNFNVAHDHIGQQVLNGYIPALIVIGYDGYYIYQFESYRNEAGETEFRHVWSPKKTYTYTDQQHNIYAFTLDDYVTIRLAADGKWLHGFRSELQEQAQMKLLDDEHTFDAIRRTTIVNALQNDLAHTINRYNADAKRYGVSYTFTVPYIPQQDWNNTINDAGVLAFVQGIPLGTQYYNNYALGGAKIVKTDTFTGIVAEGRKYYFSTRSCQSPYAAAEMFTSAKEAAEKGYFPLACTRRY